jgi:hypothetical protein
MNVLADLLEVTATCIGDLVRETRERARVSIRCRTLTPG